jgi:crossover junction endodeoxyribonuclease RuvC
MTARPILGIDPGITGGIAALYPDGRIKAYDIPTVDGSVDVDALVRRVREHAPRLAVIEKAQAMPKQGVVSVFRYGCAYGALCAVTALCEIPTRLVSPRRWKNHFGSRRRQRAEPRARNPVVAGLRLLRPQKRSRTR